MGNSGSVLLQILREVDSVEHPSESLPGVRKLLEVFFSNPYHSSTENHSKGSNSVALPDFYGYGPYSLERTNNSSSEKLEAFGLEGTGFR